MQCLSQSCKVSVFLTHYCNGWLAVYIHLGKISRSLHGATQGYNTERCDDNCIAQPMTPGTHDTQQWWTGVDQALFGVTDFAQRHRWGLKDIFFSKGSSGTNPSNAFAISLSDAGNEPEMEQFEDVKIGLQCPPQIREEAQILCMTGPHDIPTMEFHVVPATLDKILIWLRAPENVHMDFSQARCITLVFYPIQDMRSHAIQQGESCNCGFDIHWPVPWRKILTGLSFLMNDVFTFSPACEASEYFFDISEHVRLGRNKLCFLQVDPGSEYVLVLYSHYPTES
ncbi:hypothetical protein EI94DRAFT_1701502 [Lactarius quietus]|nr:hypothetical protein EI94DRAFT_1701502 [Lactarius quietus]